MSLETALAISIAAGFGIGTGYGHVEILHHMLHSDAGDKRENYRTAKKIAVTLWTIGSIALISSLATHQEATISFASTYIFTLFWQSSRFNQ